MSTIVLDSVFVLVQYLSITFLSNQDAKLDMHSQEQSELWCSKHPRWQRGVAVNTSVVINEVTLRRAQLLL